MPHHRGFGTYADEYLPGMGIGYLGPGVEAPGEEGLIIPAPAIAAINWSYQQEDIEKRRAAAREARIEASEAAAELARRIAWEKRFTFGAVRKPETETLRGYKHVLRFGAGTDHDIEFAPDIYGVFDGIIVGKSTAESAAFNPNHPYYANYAPLRRNIAILRNYLLVQMFPDAEFKPQEKSPAGAEDRDNYFKVQQMAEKLGHALAGRQPGMLHRFLITCKRLFTGEDLTSPYTTGFLETANIPDKGIEVMYNYLLEQQKNTGWRDVWPFGMKPGNWGIPPISNTPFSHDNILMFSHASRMQGMADEFARIVRELRSIDELTPETKKISVEYAKEILDKLKLLLGNSNEESFLSLTSDAHEDEGWMLLRAARSFKDAMADIARIDINLLKNNQTLRETLDVLDEISFYMKREAAVALTESGRKGDAEAMTDRMRKTPANMKGKRSLPDLIGKLRTGLNEAACVRQAALTHAADAQHGKVQVQNMVRAASAKGVKASDIKALKGDPMLAQYRIAAASRQVAQSIKHHQDELAAHQAEEARKKQQNPSNTIRR